MRRTFVSYATADRREASAICRGLERRGLPCWIACRDVAPGANYQEAIVQAIRDARALVLVFSASANRSDEIKKELSLASRARLPVVALRLAPVEPSDAFAYELATRQWVDAFPDRDAALDVLVSRLGETARSGEDAAPTAAAGRRRAPSARAMLGAIAGVVLAAAAIAVGVTAWRAHAPSAAPARSMAVRLAPFERLSPDLPPGIADAMRDEITTAVNQEGVVRIAAGGAGPDAARYALGGSIRRDGDVVRVFTRLGDARSGATLWSHTFDFPQADLARAPRVAAVDAGSVLRCGLFGASTYPRALPDGVLADYLQACQDYGETTQEPLRALVAARRVVAALPDFSWGWSAVAIAAGLAADGLPAARAAPLRAEGLAATATALRLDRSNSEALAWRSLLMDPGELAQREALLLRAIRARPLYCGCEHLIYADFLEEVGRGGDALAEFQQAQGMLALDYTSEGGLALALAGAGDVQGARAHMTTSLDLIGAQKPRYLFPVLLGLATADWKGALAAIDGSPVGPPPREQAAWSAALRALAGGDAPAKAAAIPALAALPVSGDDTEVATDLLGALGAGDEALAKIEAAAPRVLGARQWLFTPRLAAVRAEPSFAAAAARLGLLRYWRSARVRPDACAGAASPPFCRGI